MLVVNARSECSYNRVVVNVRAYRSLRKCRYLCPDTAMYEWMFVWMFMFQATLAVKVLASVTRKPLLFYRI